MLDKTVLSEETSKMFLLSYPCTSDLDLLQFVWKHAPHGIEYVEYDNEGFGLACPCHMKQNQLLLLHMGVEEQGRLSEESWNLIWQFHPDSKEG